MNYVKSCLIITMLLGVGYSQCNESNWEEYYPNMAFCYLDGADLSGADFTDAMCTGAFFVRANLEGTNFDGASLTYKYFDENEDFYDDVSYDAGFSAGFSAGSGADYDDGYVNGYINGAESGDLNLDGVDNVQDVVLLVNNILLFP